MTLALQDTHDADKLAALLCDLLEPSRPLREILVPAVLLRLTASKQVTASQLIDLCEQVATGWTYDQKADFIAGHPLIGEVKNLSAHSEKEQANSVPTPPIVLERYVNCVLLLTEDSCILTQYTVPSSRACGSSHS